MAQVWTAQSWGSPLCLDGRLHEQSLTCLSFRDNLWKRQHAGAARHE